MNREHITSVVVWPTTIFTVWISAGPFHRNCCVASAVWRSECRRSRWCCCFNSVRHVSSFRYRGSPNITTTSAVNLWHLQHCSPVVPIVSDRPETVRASWKYQVVYYDSGMWRAAGVSARASLICSVHCRLDSTNWKPWTDASLVCRWHTGVWFVSAICCQRAFDDDLWVCRRRCQLGQLQSTSAERRENWGNVVCN